MDLPGELRNTVYGHAFASGDMALLRTSKTVNLEAMPLLDREGFFRLEMQDIQTIWDVYSLWDDGRRVSISHNNYSAHALSLIQNVDLNVNFDLRLTKGDREMESNVDFVNALLSGTQQQVCTITLQKFNMVVNALRPTKCLQALHCLSGFHYVFLAAIAEPMEGARIPGVGHGPHHRVARARNSVLYRVAKEVLEPRLGPSVWHDAEGQEGRYLEFRPARYQTSLQIDVTQNSESN